MDIATLEYQIRELEKEGVGKYLEDLQKEVSKLAFSFLIRQLKMEMKQGLLTPILIIGQPGSGKSLTALTIALLFSGEKFTLRNVVFTATDFLDRVNNAKKGETIIFDDAGVEYNARQWTSHQNKLISSAIQVMRFKRFLPIWTCPSINMIDINARTLTKYVIKTYKTEFERRNPRRIIASLFMTYDGYIYEPAIVDFGGESLLMKNIKIPAPPKRICDVYNALASYQKSIAMRRAKETAIILDEYQKKKLKKKMEDLFPREERGKTFEGYPVG